MKEIDIDEVDDTANDLVFAKPDIVRKNIAK